MPTKSPPRRLSYGMGEAAEALGVSRQFLYRLVARGEIRTVTIGARRLIRAAELERLLDKGAP